MIGIEVITRICDDAGERRRRRRRCAVCRLVRSRAVVAVHDAGCRSPSTVYRPSALHPGVRGNSNIEYVTTIASVATTPATSGDDTDAMAKTSNWEVPNLHPSH